MLGIKRILTFVAVQSVAARALSTGTLQGFRTDGIGGSGITLVPKDEKYNSVVVWMHGLGDTADGWASLMPMLDVKETKFILPTANQRPITLNGGYEMPGWSDIYGLDESSPEDADGFMESARRVEEIVLQEIENGIASENMVIGGFSQGGALALHYTLRSKYRFAGVAALSTWLPLRGDYPGVITDEAKSSLRLFQAHGSADEVVQLPWGKSSHLQLKEWVTNGKSDTIKDDFQFLEIQNMGHSSDQEEIDALRDVLKKWLGK